MRNLNNNNDTAREAFIRRCKTRYWIGAKPPRINTHVGEIYEVDFGENIGSEFSGRHLALCLSNTRSDEERMLVIPLTTKFKEYNLKHIISTYSYSKCKIHAGVVLNEIRLISKLRLFSTSLILREREDDGIYHVGHVTITEEQLKEFKEVSI